ncbi:MAG TPA: 50S ribosomal protein L17 [Pelovirga sp.]|nr:50S ribosomal protein L17 [Pelovirga sp.]
MRHNKSGRTLGRKPDHRQHMMRNMVTSFLLNEKITTTVTRAKELRKLAEKMITLAKRGDLHSRRQAMRVIREPQVVARLFEMIAPRYADRPGGYTRILRLDNRLGDNAPMAIIELVEEGYVAPVTDDTDEESIAVEQKEAAAN